MALLWKINKKEIYRAGVCPLALTYVNDGF